MNPFPLCFLILMAALSLPGSAQAVTQPVDDSASQVLGGNTKMKWDSPVPRRGERPTVSGELTVLARLNVSQWKGRPGRIFMTLPVQPGGAITTTWTTRGVLLPGTLSDGGRALVYAGPITSDVIEDTLRLTIQADGRKLVRPEQLHYSFEIDMDSP